MKRNLLFVRSLAFGIGAKLLGSLVVFVGIPILSKYLAHEEYELFLKSMSAASLFLIPYGALGTTTVRDIAKLPAPHDASEFAASVRESLYGYLAVTAISLLGLLATGLFLELNTFRLVAAAAILTILTGLFQIGDAVRVATRKDFISSIFQAGSSLVLVMALLLMKPNSTIVAISLYFGVPALCHAIITAQLLSRIKYLSGSSVTLKGILTRVSGTGPLLIGSLIDYAKVFGSGILLSEIAGPHVYILYQTLVLMIARLVNPISLLTRPLLPAYLDAIRTEDHNWIDRGNLVIALGFCGGTVCLLGGVATMPMNLLNTLVPSSIGQVQRLSAVLLTLFFLGHASNTLIAPVFIAMHKMNAYLYIGAITTLIGLTFGGIVGRSYADGMLAAMSISIFSAAGLNILYLFRKTRLRSTYYHAG